MTTEYAAAFDEIVDVPVDYTRPPEFTDEALALRFAEHHAEDLRFAALWSKWLRWDGSKWRFDDTLAAYDLVREICRQASSKCNKPKMASALASGKTVAAVERLARSDRRIAATVDQWDADPWLLNTPNGTVDLRTGKNRQHLQSDYITKCTAVAPEGNCPRWHEFLASITNDDNELQQFLQRMCGYGLVGVTWEHALFFLYGLGANGKTTFLNAIIGMLGDYHRTAPIETFTVSRGERHPTELAGLRGARLVTASETEQGRRWAESRLKTLTGGERVAARFMRQDWFEFTPQFKLVIVGNHRPGLRSVDEAIRRRFHLVPFEVTILPEERDQKLSEKLRHEWPGILAWAVQGCLDWQERGLAPPRAVSEATAKYLESEDAIAAWMEECCDRDPNAQEKRGDLFASWKSWTTKTGEFTGTEKQFIAVLETRHGIKPYRTSSERGFRGLHLRKPPEPDLLR